jgi:hypothetical protein
MGKMGKMDLERLADGGRVLCAHDLALGQEFPDVRGLQEFLQLLTLTSFHFIVFIFLFYLCVLILPTPVSARSLHSSILFRVFTR